MSGADFPQPLMHCTCSGFCHLCFMSNIHHWIVSCPPVHQYDPFFKGQLGLGEETTIPDAGALVAIRTAKTHSITDIWVWSDLEESCIADPHGQVLFVDSRFLPWRYVTSWSVPKDHRHKLQDRRYLEFSHVCTTWHVTRARAHANFISENNNTGIVEVTTILLYNYYYNARTLRMHPSLVG